MLEGLWEFRRRWGLLWNSQRHRSFEYHAECVSIWDQPDWKEIREEFDLLNNLEIQLGRPWRNRSTKYTRVV